MSKIWYKWPQNYYEKPWHPWYKIMRGVLVFPFLLLTFGLFYTAVLLGVGLDEAEGIRKDIF